MIKGIGILLASICLLVAGCNKPHEFTEITPAQLELEWEQILDQNNSSNPASLSTIPAELAQQLVLIGPYRTSSSIIYAKQEAKVVYKLVFLNEMTIDDMPKIMPSLKSIFKGKTVNLTFHGKLEKHVKDIGFGVLSRSQSDTVTFKAQITGNAITPG